MEITAPKQTLQKTPQEIYDLLNKLPNIEKLMPEDLIDFQLTGEDSLYFILKGMPKIYLKRGNNDPPSRIVLESAREAYPFHIAAQIDAIDDSSSEVTFDFMGDFNPIMEMMIKSPITNLINNMAENLHKLT